MGFFAGLSFAQGIFLVFVGNPRDLLGSGFLLPIGHPCHLKSRVPFPPGFQTKYKHKNYK